MHSDGAYTLGSYIANLYKNPLDTNKHSSYALQPRSRFYGEYTGYKYVGRSAIQNMHPFVLLNKNLQTEATSGGVLLGPRGRRRGQAAHTMQVILAFTDFAT